MPLEKSLMTDIPENIGAWTREENPEIILPEKIFDYMDGAGELYLAYRLRRLQVYRFLPQERTEEEILLELYHLQTADDSYGVLSTDWGGERLDCGTAVGFYGSGLLRIRSGSVFIRILARGETPASKKAVLELAHAITLAHPQSTPPAITSLLPSAYDRWTLQKDTMCFFHSHLVLNSQYFLSTGNPLHLGQNTDAVIAEYRSPESTAGTCRRLLAIRYPSAKTALQAGKDFLKVYLPDRPLDGASRDALSMYHLVEDGWLGCESRGDLLLLAFAVADENSARGFLQAVLRN